MNWSRELLEQRRHPNPPKPRPLCVVPSLDHLRVSCPCKGWGDHTDECPWVDWERRG